jgi:acetylornithine deacetylase
VDAIAMMARIVVALEDLDARMHTGPGHALLGHSAVVASLVHGGSELFTYPAECEAQFVWRTLPGQSQATLTAELARIFAALKDRDPRFDAALEWRLWREPMLIADDVPIARAVAEAMRDELGKAPEVCGAPWWTDAALIQAAGIPAVILGPRGGGIHAADEWVELQGLERLERILLGVTRRFCQ